MSKRKDKERASQYIYRNGRKVPRKEWDKYQRELKEANEAQRLASIGLVRGKAKILTPEEIWKERRPVHGKDLPRG